MHRTPTLMGTATLFGEFQRPVGPAYFWYRPMPRDELCHAPLSKGSRPTSKRVNAQGLSPILISKRVNAQGLQTDFKPCQCPRGPDRLQNVSMPKGSNQLPACQCPQASDRLQNFAMPKGSRPTSKRVNAQGLQSDFKMCQCPRASDRLQNLPLSPSLSPVSYPSLAPSRSRGNQQTANWCEKYRPAQCPLQAAQC
jgi:hypothetical protein